MVLPARYMVLFRNFLHLSVLAVTDEIAKRAVILRAYYGLKPPGALQLPLRMLLRL